MDAGPQWSWVLSLFVHHSMLPQHITSESRHFSGGIRSRRLTNPKGYHGVPKESSRPIRLVAGLDHEESGEHRTAIGIDNCAEAASKLHSIHFNSFHYIKFLNRTRVSHEVVLGAFQRQYSLVNQGWCRTVLWICSANQTPCHGQHLVEVRIQWWASQ